MAGGRSTAGVVRIGDMVHRPVGERSAFVHGVLVHLERVGFVGAPRFRGIDGVGREMLTFLEGDVGTDREPGGWTDEQLVEAARLLRRFHDATAGTVFAGDQEVVCHNDCAPWNTVFVEDLPVGLIDFDEAAPGPRIKDLSYAVWCWLGVSTPGRDLRVLAERIALMCVAYGHEDTRLVLPGIAARMGEINAKHLGNGWIEQAESVAAGQEWLKRHQDQLQRYLDEVHHRGDARPGELAR